jgi:hypothetical protein
MGRIYIYVVDRDFGFAPNPFHGFCTLATCKPRIRNTAKVGDWVIGVGGSQLKAKGRCVFAMLVSKIVTFNDYWTNENFIDKKPVRNGSKKMLLGDNIYFYDNVEENWHQAPSHHSNPDGTINLSNKNRDTQSNNVLIADQFFYFGVNAPSIPENMLKEIGYENCRNHRVFSWDKAKSIINWLETTFEGRVGLLSGDPFNFDESEAHYSVQTNKVTKVH